jgi:hypothetical protein
VSSAMELQLEKSSKHYCFGVSVPVVCLRRMRLEKFHVYCCGVASLTLLEESHAVECEMPVKCYLGSR